MSTEGSAHIKANNNEIVFNQDITHDGGTIIGVTVGADSANTPQISSLREFVVEASNNQITFNKAVEIFNNLDIQVVRVGDIDDVYSQDTNSVEMVQIATNGNSLSLGGGSEFALNTGTSGVENSNIGTSQIYASSYMDTQVSSSNNSVKIGACISEHMLSVVSSEVHASVIGDENATLNIENLNNRIEMEGVKGDDVNAIGGITHGFYISNTASVSVKTSGNRIALTDSHIAGMVLASGVVLQSLKTENDLDSVVVEANDNEVLVSGSSVYRNGVIGVSLGMSQ